MKTILVPTDFSDASRNASRYAVNLAKSLNYKVLLFHVYTMPMMVAGEFPTTDMIDLGELEQGHKKRLEEEAELLGKGSDVVIECKSMNGFTVDEIAGIEEKEKPDLIIMGLSASGRISEFVFGSISTDVVKNSQTPVIIVPEASQFKEIKKIAFASDLKMECEMKMHEPLKDMIDAFGSGIAILNVVKEQSDKIGKDDGVSGRRIEKYFENREHIYHFLENNDIIAGISEFIVSHHVDMVTMIPQKHNLIERLFKESNTKKMAFHVDIPLLTLPAMPCD
jgi:nucleotide-binding universal stress UspA family protein